MQSLAFQGILGSYSSDCEVLSLHRKVLGALQLYCPVKWKLYDDLQASGHNNITNLKCAGM